MWKKLKPTDWAALVLVAGVFFQIALLGRGVIKDLSRARATIGKSGLWRSANFYQGNNFANYIQFLDEHIPPNGRVVLPPEGVGPKALGTVPVMQFFLAPRTVINCTSADCLENLSSENTYLLAINRFPPDPPPRFTSRLMFDDRWGLLLPSVSSPARSNLRWDFSSLFEISLSLIGPLLWMGALLLSGFWLACILLPAEKAAVRLALGYGLGWTAFTLAAAVLSLCGVPLAKLPLLVLTAALLAGSAALFFSRRSRASPGTLKLFKAGADAWEYGFLALAALAGMLSVGLGYHASDAILLWGAKGYGIASSASLAQVMDWGTNTVYYPLHLPLVIAAFKVISGDLLPASKLVFSGYFAATLFLVYHFLNHFGVSRRLAGLATMLAALAPLIFRHATIGYANLALSYALLSGTVLLVQGMTAEVSREKERRLFTGGLFLAATAWTRPEGLITSWIMASLIALYALSFHRGALWLKRAALFFSPLVVYSLFWEWLKARVYTSPIASAGLYNRALGQILAGNLHIQEAIYVLKSIASSFFRVGTWGGWGIAILLGVLLFCIARAWRQSLVLLLMLAGGLYTAMIAGMYYLTSYLTNQDISWWVSTGLERMMFPALFFLWLGGINSLNLLDHRVDRASPADPE